MAVPNDIPHAVERLRAGGLVAFPTETVYGLGADAYNAAAVDRVFTVKGRPSRNPLIVHVSGPGMARRTAGAWPQDAERLARAFWPGPLSIVVPRDERLPRAVTAGGPTVALRCPDHPLTLALIEAFGSSLVGPSANPSGRVSPTTAAHVRAAFSERDVMVLDGGPCRGGIESTVVSLTGPPRVLRPGLVSPLEIARVLGREVAEGAAPDTQAGPAESPGLLASHYAPSARTVLAERAEIAGLLAAAPGPAAVLTLGALAVPAPHRVISMPNAAEPYAAALYASLREADVLGPSLIVVERPGAVGDEHDRAVWAAILDRLARAAAGA